jgi:hypothetical protein
MRRAPEPPVCRWPRGCFQRPCLVEEEGGRLGLCFWHFKLTTGLVTTDVKNRSGADTAAVLSDEQTSIAEALVALGVDRGEAFRMARGA